MHIENVRKVHQQSNISRENENKQDGIINDSDICMNRFGISMNNVVG